MYVAAIDPYEPSSAFFPRLISGETLYSWVSRYHRLNYNINGSQTSKKLFGHSSSGLRHDFPTRLDQLAINTRGILGSTLALIKERTSYAFYEPFMNDRTSADVIRAMKSGSFGSIRDSLGLSASRLSVPAPLKACKACLREEMATYQTTWWRIEQQWPTVRICRRHQEALAVARDEIHSRALRDLILPSDLDAHNTFPTHALNENQFKRLTIVADWTEALIGQHRFRFDHTLLRHAYLLQAKKHGWVAMDGSVRLQAMRDAFSSAHFGLEQLPGLSFLGGVSDVNGGFIGLLLRQYSGRRHPMKHIYLMAFLFSDPEEFFDLYRKVATMAKTEGTSQLPAQLTDIRGRLRDLVANRGKSVNSAAGELSIYATQAVRYLKRANVPYQKRPRVLTPTLEIQLKKMLHAGDTRDEIAATLSIRKSYIKDYLARNASLRSDWEKAYAERKLAKYRAHFLKLIEDNPGIRMKQIRQMPGSSFQWLFRHDRFWLENQLPSLWKNAT